MTNGENFMSTSGGSNEVLFMQGVTQQCRDYQMGAFYWPGIRINDGFRLQTVNGSGTNLTLTTTNTTGRDRLRYGWGCSAGTGSCPVCPVSTSTISRNDGKGSDPNVNTKVENCIGFNNNSVYYSVPYSSSLTINLYTLQGRLVRTLFNGKHESGEGRVVVPSEISQGSYLVSLKGGTYNFDKILLIER
jgi:hypothetical protein